MAKTKPAVSELRSVRLDLPATAHQLLQIISGYEGKSMALCARDAVIAYVQAEAKRRGVKL